MTHTTEIKVPDLGGAETVEVIEVLVSEGDAVSVDDSLITLESDKASMEVPAAEGGVIQKLTVSVGDTVKEGDVIGTLELVDGGGTAENDSTNDPTKDTTDDKVADQTTAQPKDETKGQAESKSAAATEAKVTQNEPAAKAESSQEVAKPSKPAASTSPTAHISDEKIKKAHASPGVRRYAREHGADLSLVKGTGPKGRILRDDVREFIKGAMEGAGSNYGGAGAASGAGIPALPEVDFTKFGEVERVEMGRINKLSAANLHRAWLNLPMVTHHDEGDITEMEAFRKELKASHKEGDPKVTGLAFQMKALVQSLKTFPKLNSSLSVDGQALFLKKYFHIGIAVDTPNGLVVPVFKDVDKKSIMELAEEMADMSSRARAKKLKPDEMQGASMTISSLGGIGGTGFSPIINPPEVAILGISRAKMQPVWNGTEFKPRLICPFSLTYDHRVVDGADAARFMAHYVETISDIRRLML